MPRAGAVYDGYFHTSPECWSVFTEVVGAEFQNAVLFGQVHQLTVDAYAAQHAGGAHPDKSVDVHLVGMYLAFERGIPPVEVPRYLQRLATSVSTWPHFPPPIERGSRTVFDIALAGSAREHAERVREWARQVWSAWREHHELVAALAQKCCRPADLHAPPARRMRSG